MGYMMMVSPCVNCGKTLICNPDAVPSIRVNGTKEPLCENCFNEWNEIHRTSKGLEPVKLNPKAYEPAEEE